MMPPKVMKKPDVTEHPLHFYRRTEDAWAAMYEDCNRATEIIELEQYILANDETGRRFIALFVDKLRQGVRVRLILDSVGSRDLYMSLALDDFRAAGGAVYFYNPISIRNLFAPAKWFPRSHNKIMIIDRHICYIGSVCISKEMGEWEDMHVRINGILARDIAADFDEAWKAPQGKLEEKPQSKEVTETGYAYIVSQQRLRPNLIYKRLLREIGRAKSSVYIVTPYFLPPWLLRRSLKKAQRRGVDVRVMVSAKTDVPIADCVSRSYYPDLFRHGIRIFHYLPTVLHAKYVIIDGNWATIGSTNMDYLSLLRNREANIVLKDAADVAELRVCFNDCLSQSREVDGDYYRQLPLAVKILGRLGRLARRIL